MEMDDIAREKKPLTGYLRNVVNRIELGYTVATIEEERESASHVRTFQEIHASNGKAQNTANGGSD